MSSRIAVLKVILDGVKPTVMRWLVVPLTIRLGRLHLVLQAAIEGTNSHLCRIASRKRLPSEGCCLT
jgi:Plasmid pRiA4b ORF-3-like protein